MPGLGPGIGPGMPGVDQNVNNVNTYKNNGGSDNSSNNNNNDNSGDKPNMMSMLKTGMKALKLVQAIDGLANGGDGGDTLGDVAVVAGAATAAMKLYSDYKQQRHEKKVQKNRRAEQWQQQAQQQQQLPQQSQAQYDELPPEPEYEPSQPLQPRPPQTYSLFDTVSEPANVELLSSLAPQYPNSCSEPTNEDASAVTIQSAVLPSLNAYAPSQSAPLSSPRCGPPKPVKPSLHSPASVVVTTPTSTSSNVAPLVVQGTIVQVTPPPKPKPVNSALSSTHRPSFVGSIVRLYQQIDEVTALQAVSTQQFHTAPVYFASTAQGAAHVRMNTQAKAYTQGSRMCLLQAEVALGNCCILSVLGVQYPSLSKLENLMAQGYHSVMLKVRLSSFTICRAG
jgi:hypothetical protein